MCSLFKWLEAERTFAADLQANDCGLFGATALE